MDASRRNPFSTNNSGSGFARNTSSFKADGYVERGEVEQTCKGMLKEYVDNQ
jgi:hypothetical protein